MVRVWRSESRIARAAYLCASHGCTRSMMRGMSSSTSSVKADAVEATAVSRAVAGAAKWFLSFGMSVLSSEKGKRTAHPGQVRGATLTVAWLR